MDRVKYVEDGMMLLHFANQQVLFCSAGTVLVGQLGRKNFVQVRIKFIWPHSVTQHQNDAAAVVNKSIKGGSQFGRDGFNIIQQDCGK